MNNKRRKHIRAVKEKIEDLFRQLSCDIKEELESIASEEQDYFDNMPESIQDGERGQRAQEVVEQLENSVSELENLDASEIISSIDEAIQ